MQRIQRLGDSLNALFAMPDDDKQVKGTTNKQLEEAAAKS